MQENKSKNVVNANIHESILKPALQTIVDNLNVFWDRNENSPPSPLQMQQDNDEEVGRACALFVFSDFKTSMMNTGEYSSGIPICWIDRFLYGTPGVPLSMNQMEDRSLRTLLIGVTPDQYPTDGGLVCLNPKELILSFLGGMHQEFQSKQLTEQDKREYQRKTMCTRVKFVYVMRLRSGASMQYLPRL